MRRKALTILGMGLVACGLTPAARAQVAPPPPGGAQIAPAPTQRAQVAPAPTQGSQNDRDAGKRETIRGVISGVTVAGELTFDPTTNRAQAVEASFLTIVGSPMNERDRRAEESATRSSGNDQGRSRHNVYALWMTPQTDIRDATSQANAGASENQGVRTTFDKLEIGDKVEVTFNRRENANTGGDPRNEMRMRRHGRHRTFYGDVVSVTILSDPSRQGEAAAPPPPPPSERAPGSKPEGRDDDKDKVKNNE